MEVPSLSSGRVSNLPLVRRWHNIEQAQSNDSEAHNVRLPSGDVECVCYSGASVMADKDDLNIGDGSVTSIGVRLRKSFEGPKSHAELVVLRGRSAVPISR